MAYDEFTSKMVRKCSELEQALAEKDMEWKRRVGLDCGGHSCFYAIEKTGMRHNGRCSCDPKRTKQDYDVLYAKYQQLMEQAVRFAEGYKGKLEKEHGGKVFQYGQYELVAQFLQSPEVLAWKEQK